MQKNLDSLIKYRFKDTLKKAINDYFYTVEINELDLDLGREDVILDTLEVNELSDYKFWYGDAPGSTLWIGIRLKASLQADGTAYNGPDIGEVVFSQQVEHYFCLVCFGDLAQNFQTFKVQKVYAGYLKPKSYFELSNNLIPILKKEELDDYATSIVENVYPEALEEPQPIDEMEFAKRIDLNIVYKDFEDDDVLGQIHFEDTDILAYANYGEYLFSEDEGSVVVSKGTAIIDGSTRDSQYSGKARNTVIHECIHWYKDQKPILLAKMLKKQKSAVLCCKKGDIYSQSDPQSWIEWHARALAPRVLMPKKPFIEMAEYFITQEIVENPELPEPDIYAQVVKDLAAFFGVSQSSARIRMTDLGFDKAKGVLYWCDGDYVPSYTTTTGDFPENYSYILSVSDLYEIIQDSPEIYAALQDRSILYLEKHLVKNRKEFLEYDKETGNLQLTRYARTHIDQSCYPIYRNYYLITDEVKRARRSCLNRDLNSNYGYDVSSIPDIEIEDISDEERFVRATTDIDALIDGFPDDPKEDLNYCLKWAEMTQEELAEASHMKLRQLQRYLAGEVKNPKREAILAICAGMRLPSEAIRVVLEDLGLQLSPKNKIHRMYAHLIDHCSELGIDKWNSFLEAKGAPPLKLAEEL